MIAGVNNGFRFVPLDPMRNNFYRIKTESEGKSCPFDFFLNKQGALFAPRPVTPDLFAGSPRVASPAPEQRVRELLTPERLALVRAACAASPQLREQLRFDIERFECAFPNPDVLHVTGTLSNAGGAPFWGAGLRPEFDRLGFRAVANETGVLVLEDRFDFPWRIILPGEKLNFETWLPLTVPPGLYRLMVGAVRERLFWMDGPPCSADCRVLPGAPAMAPFELNRGRPGLKQVALTFDAGGNHEGDRRLLAVLRKHCVPATFFVAGRSLLKHKDLLKEAQADGHQIANHTDTHRRLCFFGDSKVQEDMAARLRTELFGMEQRFAAEVGGVVSKFWRAPFGAVNRRLLLEARRLGFIHVGWTIDSEDWRLGQAGFSGRSVIDEVIKQLAAEPDGAIILLHLSAHDPVEPLSAHLPRLLEFGESLGCRWVTVEELMHGLNGAGQDALNLSGTVG